MTPSYLRNIPLLLVLWVVSVQCSSSNISTAITTRFWDCCKPSCSWKEKAKVTGPVLTCDKQDNPFRDFAAGTGCGTGGTAYSCSDQQPWAVNDTFSYGFAGIYIEGHVEDFWCCACYQLNFTSGPVKGKSMIVQASNTAYDVKTTNRFSLAIPGGNTTSHDGCANQFGVSQTVFGETNQGVSSVDDCENLPEAMRPGCRWRFDWFKDADYPT
ncbi:RlpA-like double-psi beta-barrel-protein domain-containing protein-containing protein [Clohesyomyces aquaticus]|uniref:cellulase n=1 Tax=Clohesyomyces aquaticus TaxID=1231657 RepID=A0A1Y2A996_9PLEO|nr:RlpA-like double-psi beta-barrel-protein domain-containing protein-containing protein [Clohesyomyces aquaticus]